MVNEQDDQIFKALVHFSKYMHNIADEAAHVGIGKGVQIGCKIVAHVADAVLHAADEMEAEEVAKK